MTQHVKITNVGSLMAQNIISLIVNASPHGVVFSRIDEGLIIVVTFVFGFGAGVVFGEFLRLWGVIGNGKVSRGVALGIGSNRLFFGLVEALEIFAPERSTACVAHETITIPLKTSPHPIGFSSIHTVGKNATSGL